MSVHHCSIHGIMWHISTGGCGWCAVESERDALKAEVEAVSAAIGTTRYMDPPDGGSVTLAEQVERLSRELAEAHELVRGLTKMRYADPYVPGSAKGFCGSFPYNERIKTIHAACRGGRGEGER